MAVIQTSAIGTCKCLMAKNVSPSAIWQFDLIFPFILCGATFCCGEVFLTRCSSHHLNERRILKRRCLLHDIKWLRAASRAFRKSSCPGGTHASNSLTPVGRSTDGPRVSALPLWRGMAVMVLSGGAKCAWHTFFCICPWRAGFGTIF